MKYRLNLTEAQYEELRRVLENAEDVGIDVGNTLDWLIKATPVYDSYKVKMAAAVATATRSARARDKIENAVRHLQLDGKKITAYAVAKEAGVAFQTAKKYLDEL